MTSVTKTRNYDVAIVGAGPGGYVAGICATQRGLSACVIEKDAPGGVCLNWGCIPSKSLIHQATGFLGLKQAEEIGVRVDRSGFDYARVHAKSRQAANILAAGIRALLRKNRVELLQATATLAGPRSLKLTGGEHTGTVVEARHLIIATGSRPLSLQGFEIDERDVLSSTGLLALEVLPKSIVILGAGAIGCEFAYVLRAFGAAVTLVEMAPRILPVEDGEAAAVVAASFRAAGIDVRTGCRAMSLERTAAGLEVRLRGPDGGTSKVTAQKVLAAFGRVPNTQGIGLEEVGIRCDERGRIVTGPYGETSVRGIYAIGDLTRSPALAHVASREAEIAIDHIVRGEQAWPRTVAADLVPSAVYCEPQLAGFGLREEEANAKGIPFKKSVFPYRGAGKSVALERTEGFVKILTAPETGEILGAHIVGAEATELIHELLLARQAELLPEDIESMIHAHPTLSEAVMEAARGVHGRPIHL